MVSAREAGFNLRESCPLTRHALQNHDQQVVDNRVSERSHSGACLHRAYRGWRLPFSSPKDSSGKAGKRSVTIGYPDDVRDTAKSGMGCQANRHLRCLAESDHENVGGCRRDVKESRPPRPEEVSSQYRLSPLHWRRRSGHSTWRLRKAATWGRATVRWDFRGKGNRMQTRGRKLL
jgi:hypothetical protein